MPDCKPALLFLFFFNAVLGFELRVYTLNHFICPLFFVVVFFFFSFFEIGP
jgi:hypothetical protein